MQTVWSLSGRGLALSALALSLAACQSMRGPQPGVNTDIPASYTSYATAGQSIAAQGYKDFFADPRLVQVLDLALANNRDLRSATLNIQKAQQQYQISENNQLPTIGASGSAVRQVSPTRDPNNPYSTYQVGLGLTAYELDFWGRVRSLKDAALDSYLATQSSRDATQISLISQVTQVWLNYAYANAQLTGQSNPQDPTKCV